VPTLLTDGRGLETILGGPACSTATKGAFFAIRHIGCGYKTSAVGGVLMVTSLCVPLGGLTYAPGPTGIAPRATGLAISRDWAGHLVHHVPVATDLRGRVRMEPRYGDQLWRTPSRSTEVVPCVCCQQLNEK
jgi:hypothetical protein